MLHRETGWESDRNVQDRQTEVINWHSYNAVDGCNGQKMLVGSLVSIIENKSSSNLVTSLDFMRSTTNPANKSLHTTFLLLLPFLTHLVIIIIVKRLTMLEKLTWLQYKKPIVAHFTYHSTALMTYWKFSSTMLVDLLIFLSANVIISFAKLFLRSLDYYHYFMSLIDFSTLP